MSKLRKVNAEETTSNFICNEKRPSNGRKTAKVYVGQCYRCGGGCYGEKGDSDRWGDCEDCGQQDRFGF